MLNSIRANTEIGHSPRPLAPRTTNSSDAPPSIISPDDAAEHDDIDGNSSGVREEAQLLENKKTGKLESFLKFLIERGFVDNEDDSSETIHRFLEIFEQFEEDEESNES